MRRKNKRRVIFSVVFICLAIMCCIGCSQKDDKQKGKTEEKKEQTEKETEEKKKPEDGTAFQTERVHEAMVADIKISTEWIEMEEPVLVDDIFSGRMTSSGNTVWILLDEKLKEYTWSDTLTFVREIEIEEGYEEISADDNGNLYVSGFMKPMLTICDGEIVASNEGPGKTVMHKGGAFGVSSFPHSKLEKVTMNEAIAAVEPWNLMETENLSETDITENYVYVMGSDPSTDNHTVWAFDFDGNQKFVFGNKGMDNPDWLGAVTQMEETEQGFIAFDRNMRKLYFWKTDGTFVGALEDDALFGTNYPWISAATKLPDGSILVGMAEEREDESADEFLVYRMSGF